MKYYMPWDAERAYGEMIVRLHDDHGLSFERIAVKLWKEKIRHPRNKSREPCDKERVSIFYHRCKQGWPLHDGVQWKPPSFRFTVANTIDFNKVGA